MTNRMEIRLHACLMKCSATISGTSNPTTGVSPQLRPSSTISSSRAIECSRRAPLPATVSFVTTEHFTLQVARSSTIAEATGRASTFLGAMSGGLSSDRLLHIYDTFTECFETADVTETRNLVVSLPSQSIGCIGDSPRTASGRNRAPTMGCDVGGQSSQARPGSRVVTSWRSQPLPSGSLKEAYER